MEPDLVINTQGVAGMVGHGEQGVTVNMSSPVQIQQMVAMWECRPGVASFFKRSSEI